MIKQKIKPLVFFLTLFLLSGCMSSVARYDGREDFAIYQGTILDGTFIYLAVTSDKSDTYHCRSLGAAAWCSLFVGMALVDLPLSFVVDTAFLPSDLFNMYRKKLNNKAAEAKVVNKYNTAQQAHK